jgi:hypothetical protein
MSGTYSTTSCTSRKDAPDEATVEGSNTYCIVLGITSLGNCLIKGTFSTSACSKEGYKKIPFH